MKYMLLIHQGTTPLPGTPEAGTSSPSEEQGAVYADYQGINETPGVTPGVRMAGRRRRRPCGWRTARR